MLPPSRLALAAALVVAAACGTSDAGTSGRPGVVASFYPLAFAVERVGGDRVDLTTLTPQGAEPHDLELSSGRVRAMAEADRVFYLGGGFQPVVDDVASDLGSVAVDVAAPVDVVDGDPHVWLDPARMAEIVDVIADELATVDAGDERFYRSRADRLVDDLDRLDDELRTSLSTCARDEFVTSHEAFGYLAARYGLRQIGIAGLDPEAEPSPARLAEVTELARAHDVEVVFFEDLVSPAVAETLASELGIETDVLTPLESRPPGGDYFSAMRGNLVKLSEALDCER